MVLSVKRIRAVVGRAVCLVLGKTIVETLRNSQNAAIRGVADTIDVANEGGFSGAVEHVVSPVSVVDNYGTKHYHRTVES